MSSLKFVMIQKWKIYRCLFLLISQTLQHWLRLIWIEVWMETISRNKTCNEMNCSLKNVKHGLNGVIENIIPL